MDGRVGAERLSGAEASARRRRPIIGTSWKQHLTSSEARGYLEALRPLVSDIADRDLFVLPAFPAIWVCREHLTGSNIGWGAQDVHPADGGAHTGDVSGPMLVDLGCRYVEVGHAERRRDHGETPALIGAKVAAVLRWGMTAIVCVGEAERSDAAAALGLVLPDLADCLAGVPGDAWDRVVVAYEPVWAIGAGSSPADPADVATVHAGIRGWLDDRGAASARIIYGGSVDEVTAPAMLASAMVDGLFVGRRALDPTAFATIAHAPIPGTGDAVEAPGTATARQAPAARSIAVGSDEAGFALKSSIADVLRDEGWTVTDYGCHSEAPVDYPDVAFDVARAVARGEHARAILICGTGIGMAIAANKVPGVRAAQAHDPYSAERARKSNDAQILTLGARVVGRELAASLVRTWLQAEFTGGASQRKVAKISAGEIGGSTPPSAPTPGRASLPSTPSQSEEDRP